MIKAKEESGERNRRQYAKEALTRKKRKETLRVEDRQVSQRLANYSGEEGGGRKAGRERYGIRRRRKRQREARSIQSGMGKISPIVAGRDKTRIARGRDILICLPPPFRPPLTPACILKSGSS